MRVSMYALLFGLVFVVAACSAPESNKNTDTKPLLSGMTKEGSYKVEIYSKAALTPGYNELQVSVLDSAGKAVDDAKVSLHPKMHMKAMTHAAPSEHPDGKAADGMYKGAVVFVMPDNPEEYWELTVKVTKDGKEETATFEKFSVQSPKNAQLLNFTSEADANMKYFVSIVKPENLQVGKNDFELTVHYRKDMMNFPPAEDLTIEMVPDMPSMGHGSPGNEHPTHIGNGHYKGKINFTMPGEWLVKLTIKQGDKIVAKDKSFTIELK